MIREWLRDIDKKPHPWTYDWRGAYSAVCNITGVALLALCLLTSWFLRWMGVSEWFLVHYNVRAVLFWGIGIVTSLFASTYGGKAMTPENNNFVLDFMFIPIITSTTLLMPEA